ncbi:MAG: sigma-70 family RNA polymerase sigma factor [Planctomycetota bacterium]
MIQRLLAGDAAAWEMFVDRYSGFVRGRVSDVAGLFGRKSDWSTIDDVTAEVFATLLARDGAALRCFRGQSRLSTYLSVIATRVSRRVIARVVSQAGNQSDSYDAVANAISSDSQNDVYGQLIASEEKDRLSKLMNRLPERERRLMVAFHREGQTYAEISERYAIPVGSISTTLRRAERQLKKWVDDEV